MANIAPTKGNLLAEKKKLSLARSGYELLDKKRNILLRELLKYEKEAEELRKKTRDIFAAAYASLQRAHVAGGQRVEIIRSIPVDDSLRIRFRSLMGVEIPSVEYDGEIPSMPPYVPQVTDSFFDEAYVDFVKVKHLAAESARIENSVARLREAVRVTVKRAEALKNVIIPETERTVAEITSVLEEREREEFSRMKVVKNRKNEG
ncbi:MAG: V-type ATP synthase subunit D [Clostridia bacterium]|nr:V-type ATP synthase subunit D [Clostridia bacterium]